jgi:hypothetical protein
MESLCLTKYHAMKTYSVLNQAPHHEDVRMCGDIAPNILNLDGRWSRLPMRERAPGTHCIGGSVASEPIWMRW